MGVWTGVPASRLHYGDGDDVPPRELKRAGRFALNNPPERATLEPATSTCGRYHVSRRFTKTPDISSVELVQRDHSPTLKDHW